MNRSIASTLGHVAAGGDLSLEEMSAVISAIMQGQWAENEVGLLLTGLRAKGETVEEIAGAATAMRRQMIPIRHRRQGVVDTCGTGGDGSGTFNISTAAALVTAAAGVPVAKHGNRSVTSKSGSADVLAALGVNIEAPVACVEDCLNELGICFCFATLLHPAMKQVSSVRRKLGVPTIFNLLGPLSNPANAPFQLIGVGRAELRRLLAEALSLLGVDRGLVVRGDDGLDEVTLFGPTRVSEVTPSGLRDFCWTASDFGVSSGDRKTLVAAGPEESAARIRDVLAGRSGPPRDIVIQNAAAALWTAGKSADLAECARLAATAIDSGASRELLTRWADRTNR